jgi:hypothetical protein
MKKTEIYVVINSEENRLRAIEILSNAQGEIWEGSNLFIENAMGCLICRNDNLWYLLGTRSYKTEITLDQLDILLNPKQIALSTLQLIAKCYGFDLVEKKREIKVGDFGKFETKTTPYSAFGFLKEIDEYGCFTEDLKGVCNIWANFRHLTDEEKEQITKNW